MTARPNTLSYRAEKFVQRHRLGVVGGAVLATAITGGVATTFWQANIAYTERAKAEKGLRMSVLLLILSYMSSAL